jgi:hypothetical protein
MRVVPPQRPEACRELRLWVFPCFSAVLADRQRAFDREKPRRQHGFGLHQRPEEAEDISGELASELKRLDLRCTTGLETCSLNQDTALWFHERRRGTPLF